MSKYQLEVIGDNFFLGKNKKLISNLGNKRKYKLHYQNLKTLFKFRVAVKKNHRILKFKPEPFLKANIECNTDLQRQVEREDNKIKKQNAELRNNAMYGRSIENPMNKVNVDIVTTKN